MRFHNAIMAAVAVLFTSSVANSAVVDYGSSVTGGGENIGSVGLIPSDQSGTFFTTPGAGVGLISGIIGNNSKITFSYTFSPSSPFSILGSAGGVSGSPNFASANSNGFSVATGGVFATANISGLNGTTSITNTSGGNIDFSSIFVGLLQSFSNGSGGFVGKINYNVSAVPLPAAALMFGSALAAMFGYSRLSRQRRKGILQS